MRVITSDGWNLNVPCLHPEGEPCGVAVLLHAMMVDHRTFDRPVGRGLASVLRDAGWLVFSPDFRGRGGSGPTARMGASWCYDDIVQRDVPAIIEAVRQRYSGPLVVVAHSLGAHTCLAAVGCGLLSDPPDAHVIIAGNVWLPSLERRRRMWLAKELSMRAFAAVTRARGRFPSRRLRMGSVDEAKRYVEDLSGFWFLNRWRSADGKLDYQKGLGCVRGPMLVITGSGDRLLAHRDGADAFADLMEVEQADRWRIERGWRGIDCDPDHMGLVTDGRCRPLWLAIAQWMTDAVNRGTRESPSEGDRSVSD
jgi:predicted alpha/beta hydrolase